VVKLTASGSARSFLAVAVISGSLYAFVTPAFTVPDESAHFWRSAATARGQLAPAPRPAPVIVAVDAGLREFARRAGELGGDAAIWKRRFREAVAPMRTSGSDLDVMIVPLYTALPYAPSSAVVFAGEIAKVRPLVIFYAGRLMNLMFWIGVIALAIRIAPAASSIFVSVALLPMTLFLFGSWSADAAAIALAVAFTALALRAHTATDLMRPDEVLALTGAALALALSKAAYCLLPALVVAIPAARFRSRGQRLAMIAAVGAATLAGTLVSMLYFNRAYFNFRPHLPVDPAAQMECVRHDPLRFAAVVGRDVTSNGRFYIDQIAGRFAHNEITLPDWVWRTAWTLMIVVAITSPLGVRARFRTLAFLIGVGTVLGIIASQYLIWSVVCGDLVEGVQGRYFLPVLPLFAIALGGWVKRPVPPVVLLAVAAICNAAALATIIVWYA
jgi:uncharacterized membrane protein